MRGPKKVYIKTYGCQMNVYDSERMGDALRPFGFEEVAEIADADVVILNTCHIREKAAEKVFSELGRINDAKQLRRANGGDLQVAVAGCVAQAEGAEIMARAPVVDLVVGPQSYHRLPDLLFRAHQERRRIIDIDFPVADDKFDKLPARGPRRAPSAFLTVQEGCDKFCTFCVVPYTRGAELSRPVAKILAEAEALAAQGVREVTLLGQNVNAYHGVAQSGALASLAGLVRELSRIDGLERIRYMTSHPRDMADDLIAEHAANPKLMPFLHLPLQSGSDRVLAAMNRKHTADQYLALVERVRRARADIALSTDIIVGFPGETDDDFRATLAIVRQVGFASAYTFKFSPRPGTPATGMADQVEEAVKSARLLELQALMEGEQRRFNGTLVGKTVPVLLEKPGRNHGQVVGRSPYLQAVHAAGEPELIGQIRPVEITGVGQNSLSGVIKAA